MAQVLERGELFFFYRPRLGVRRARGLDDIARFYMVVRPRDHDVYRRVIVGGKRLPEIEEHGRHWALVDRVEDDPGSIVDELRSRATLTHGERQVPAARPAGEAVYAIVDHEGHRHLAYRLELPRQPGSVQFTLRIEQEASYIVTVRNPFVPSPTGGRLEGPRYPNRLQATFRRRRFAPLEPEMLDFPGTELVLIAASVDVRRELDLVLDEQHESATEAAIFNDLALDAREHPIEPLIHGAWA
jgi:hypothetical protein